MRHNPTDMTIEPENPAPADVGQQNPKQVNTEGTPGTPLYLALGTGIAAYCLLLLISRDALIGTIAILGTGALGLVSVSLWVLWVRG